MSQKKIISILNDLILQEEKKLISTCPADNISKKFVLYSLLSVCKRGSGLEMIHFFNNKQVLMENVSFQDLTLKLTLNKIY